MFEAIEFGLFVVLITALAACLWLGGRKLWSLLIDAIAEARRIEKLKEEALTKAYDRAMIALAANRKRHEEAMRASGKPPMRIESGRIDAGTISAGRIAAGSIRTAEIARYAISLHGRQVSIVARVPQDQGGHDGELVYCTNDKRLYRYDGELKKYVPQVQPWQ